ncbi:MFS general substrate transporter [Bimuria novae-zelandiae CBS 107.79]|uniref:MFS general substrate transporter n=1 Tax=Bimuria novae-zelandiae CBS 107.79 TaxID=1447943 RepID=A0A6A5UTX0_9PLEO|nr:MFS general substrate transporter [Bimuria novae-zelandiae CBS 107.79]
MAPQPVVEDAEQHELEVLHEDTSATMPPEDAAEVAQHDERLHRRTLRKLDFLLLPFLALLFLFNSLDKSNIGNAESAHFTTDIGLRRSDLNTAVALFFAFFVALQPAGAALGRKYGMVAWVPTCMLLWGVSTALHTWVTARWQLYTLRIIIGCLEAGFYPVTVSYLSLFYTRFEFGRRLSLFYGQAAVGGALGGLISYLVFSHFPDIHHEHGDEGDPELEKRWQSWQVLFLLEGSLTMIVAAVGYLWLPHSVETAWFLTPEERAYASSRVTRDRMAQSESAILPEASTEEDQPEHGHDEESRGLLASSHAQSSSKVTDVTDDRGLSPHDVVSAFLNIRIWHILAVNILAAIPVYAFQVFLPLVLAPLLPSSTEDDAAPDPALVNLLTAPPYVFGAVMLYIFASWSDKHRMRILPVLCGLAIMVLGLILVVALPTTAAWAILRYIALNVLLSGTFIASPLTVAWISDNTPSPGKRALLLGINGWGNFAGVLSAFLFDPKYEASGYIVPFWWTLGCVSAAAVGYVLLWRNLRAENARRGEILSKWDDEEVKRERVDGRGPLEQDHRFVQGVIGALRRTGSVPRVVDWLEEAVQGGREGEEKITFVYGL